MIASARQSAARFHCDVLAVSGKQSNLSDAEEKAIQENLAQARSTGARVDVREGDDPVETIVQYARSHGITQIFVGHSMKDLRTHLYGSLISRLIRAADGMDVPVFPH